MIQLGSSGPKRCKGSNGPDSSVASNHKSDGIYLPPDDRRHFVAWSPLSKDNLDSAYWKQLWSWYAAGGGNHVATYLRTLDLEGFDPKASPPRTEAFWSIANSNRVPEDAELADVLDKLGRPEAVTLTSIAIAADNEFALYLRDRRNRRRLQRRLEECGYEPVRNDTKDGLWKLPSGRAVIYARHDLTLRARTCAAEGLMRHAAL